jgi:hypothetical protein
MSAVRDAKLCCPRCRYDLRGQTVPRCPECGLTFDDEQWSTGLLREDRPTLLDRADPWQPHQLLLRSLADMLRIVLWPPRLSKLDIHGPLWSAAVMLVLGLAWSTAIAAVGFAIAFYLRVDTSPAAAWRFGIWAGPRVVLAHSYALMCIVVFFYELAILRPGRFDLRAPIRGFSWTFSAIVLATTVLSVAATVLSGSLGMLGAVAALPKLALLCAAAVFLRVMWKRNEYRKLTRWEMVKAHTPVFAALLLTYLLLRRWGTSLFSAAADNPDMLNLL